MSLNIGARLKAIRQQNNLSQRELAKRAGVTNASISLIESNSVNPSVGSLKRVLDGIPISLAEFFAYELPEESARKVFFHQSELTEIGRGKISFKQVGTDLAEHSLQVMQETYSPGADTGKIMLRHEGEEGGVIVSGRLEVTVGERIRVLGPGDAFLFDSRLPHRFRNPGDEDCIVITACTPPSF